MSFITTEALQNISVKTVEQFLNHKVPLSEGLAKQAMESGLNSEQIQRAVEATNSIAYLKVLQLADDRTIEFPLCKYAEVIQRITIPNPEGFAKQASVAAIGTAQDSAQSEGTKLALSESEKMYYFIKTAAQNDKQLSDLRDRSITLLAELTKCAKELKSDELALTKLARVTTDEDFERISTLVTGKSSVRQDTGIFKSAELKTAEKLVGLYKEAKQVSAETAKCQALHDRAEMIKEAGLFSMVGKGLGTVASVPFRAVGAGLKGFAKNTKHNLGQVRDQGLGMANNAIRSMEGRPKIPVPKAVYKGGLGALAFGAGVAATDAAFYQPGKTSTGTSKDAWTALQKQ